MTAYPSNYIFVHDNFGVPKAKTVIYLIQIVYSYLFDISNESLEAIASSADSLRAGTGEWEIHCFMSLNLVLHLSTENSRFIPIYS